MIRNVVLVHGSFVDGAGWESVFHLLTRRGYGVSVVKPYDDAGARR
jgi:hypothetical protein